MSQNPKVAIITGASAGIGKAVAITFLKAGWKVALAGRRGDLLEAAIRESGVDAANGLAVATDVADPDAVKNLFDSTVKAFGRVDMVFNNAGVNAPGIPLEELSFEQWQSVVNINLTGSFLCVREAFRVM